MDTYRALVDELETAEKAIAAATADRAEVIDRLLQCSEQMAAVDPHDETDRHGWDAKTRAERELLFELVGLLRVPENTARNLLTESRFLVNELPATIAALHDGEISYQHARVIVDNGSSVPAEALPRFEEAVLPSAKELTVAQFKKVANREREREHPQSIGERHVAAVKERAVWLEPADDGMAVVGARLAAEVAHAIIDRLTHIGHGQPKGDGSGGDGGGGRSGSSSGGSSSGEGRISSDERSLSQKRADAFADLLLTGDTCAATLEGAAGPRPDVGHGIRPRVLVTVPVMTLLGRSDEPANLEGYGPIDPDTARDLAAHAPSFSRILVHPVTSAVLDYDRTTYAVPSDLRTVLRVRDETCRAIGCNRSVETCDADHTNDWALGGATALTNLAMLCQTHHRVKTHTG